jgi:hypothetical protein
VQRSVAAWSLTKPVPMEAPDRIPSRIPGVGTASNAVRSQDTAPGGGEVGENTSVDGVATESTTERSYLRCRCPTGKTPRRSTVGAAARLLQDSHGLVYEGQEREAVARRYRRLLRCNDPVRRRAVSVARDTGLTTVAEPR